MAGKRYWAVMIKQSLAGIIVAFFFGVIFDVFTNYPGSRSPLTAGLVACVVYWFASLTIALMGALSNALYLWLLSGDDMVDGILEEMRSLKLPPPRSGQSKNYDYLSQLAFDDEAEVIDRVRAASFTGAYNVLMSKGIFRTLAIRKALDAAVMRYSQEAPQRP